MYQDCLEQYRIILLLDSLEDYHALIKFLTERLKENSDNPIVWNNRGLAYSEIGMKNEALQDFKKSIELESAYPESYRNLGELWERSDNLDQAIIEYSKALQARSNDPCLYRMRGYAYAKIKKYEQAVSDLSEAIKLDPNFKQTYIDRETFTKKSKK